MWQQGALQVSRVSRALLFEFVEIWYKLSVSHFRSFLKYWDFEFRSKGQWSRELFTVQTTREVKMIEEIKFRFQHRQLSVSCCFVHIFMVFSIVGRHRRNSNEMKVAKPLIKIWNRVIAFMKFPYFTLKTLSLIKACNHV